MLLPLAKRRSDDRLVTIDEVEQGLACECACPFCEEPVIARKGNVRDHFFAHAPRVSNEDKECPASFERCLFWMARRILEESSELWLPDYHFHWPDGTLQKVRDAGMVPYSSATFPLTRSEQDNWYVQSGRDVVLICVGDYQIALVMVYSSKSPFENIDPVLFDGSSIGTVLIDLGGIKELFEKRARRFKDDVAEAILMERSSAKRWIYHPRVALLYRQRREATLKAEIADNRAHALVADVKSNFSEESTGRVRLNAKTGRPLPSRSNGPL